MKCPIDTHVDLVMSERHGIEIDYCPTCRGVWLDRGELDKIIERAGPVPSPATPFIAAADEDGWKRERVRRHDDDSDGYHRPGKRKKREGFLGDLFDF